MSLQQMMANDLDSFYNVEEFAITAIYNAKNIPILFEDDIELSNTRRVIIKSIVISAKSSDVSDIKIGDTIEIDAIAYSVINYEPKDRYNLEMLIALERE